jgi:two-component system sensor histidine kinase QseC
VRHIIQEIVAIPSADGNSHAVQVHALQSILQNPLSNAIEYVGRGGHVDVELSVREGVLTLSVADDGPGIAEAGCTFVAEIPSARPVLSE